MQFTARGKLRAAEIFLTLASLAFGQDELAAQSARAKQAMADRRFDEAVRLYSALARALPRNPGMLMNLGLALHSAGRYREAIVSFDNALELQPQLIPAKMLTGIDYLKLGEPAQAVAPLSDAVQAEPANPISRVELADALLSTGGFQQAVVHFRKLTELEPKDARGWQGLGMSYLSLAQQSFDAMEKNLPDSSYVFVLLANSRAEQQQYRSAFALYKHALTLDGNLHGVHHALAGIYRETGHAEWADIEEQRERESPAADCFSESAECAFLAGRYEQVIAATDERGAGEARTLYWKNRSYRELALTAFSQLAALPRSPQIYELIAETDRLQGHYRQAAEELREALQLDPGNRRLEALLAAALWHDHDFETARPLLEALVAGDPASADLNFQLGDLLLQQEEAEKALSWLEKAVRLNPRLLAAHASLARAYVRNGRPAEAIHHFTVALPLDDDGSLHFQLARACERAGKPALAKEALGQFRSISAANATKKKLLENERQITPP
jgi:tetratricopeptide (TPR) repeat protein